MIPSLRLRMAHLLAISLVCAAGMGMHPDRAWAAVPTAIPASGEQRADGPPPGAERFLPAGAPPITRFLRPDGQIDMESLRRSGYQGPLDPAGYRAGIDPRTGGPALQPARETGRTAGDPRLRFDRRPGPVPVGPSGRAFPPGSRRPGSRAEGDEFWWDGFTDPAPSLNGPINCFAVYQGELYAGGSLPVSEAGHSYGIGRWDGSVWRSVDSYPNTPVRALVVYDGKLVAGGDILDPMGSGTCLMGWDGTAWAKIGDGSFEVTPDGWGGRIEDLLVMGGDLIVGGYFTRVNGVDAKCVARWDGSVWTALATEMHGQASYSYPWVYALGEWEGSLVIGGDFADVDGVSANGIALFDGQTWSALGTDGNTSVYALAVCQGRLVAAGWVGFRGISHPGVAAWDGVSWSDLGLVFNVQAGTVDLLTDGNGLIATWIDGHAAAGMRGQVSRFDGNQWTRIGAGFDGGAGALAMWNGHLVAGGDIIRSGNQPLGYVAIHDGTDWQPMGINPNPGIGLSGPATAMAVYQGDLIVGGSFDWAGGLPARGVARWDGTAWHRMGDNTRWVGVSAMIVYQGTLLASGSAYFPGSDLMSWDGAEWQPLGGWFQGSICGMTEYQGDLIVGGSFTNLGGVAATNVARWDGATWHALGDGLGDYAYPYSNNVLSLAEYGGRLYAGGGFTHSGNRPLSHIAFWDGAAWMPVGSGISGDESAYVSALHVFHNELIAGGRFDLAGGRPIHAVARWNGATWSPIGSGFEFGYSSGDSTYYYGSVEQLATYDSVLVLSGEFWGSQDFPCYGIASWDGTNWGAFGSGVYYSYGGGGCVEYNNDLYVGGYCGAGSVYSYGLARWTGGAPPPLPPLGSISGTVYSDHLVNDCVREPGEVGLPSWIVRLDPGGQAVTTNDLGQYGFGSLPTGTYTVQAVPRANWDQACPPAPGEQTVFVTLGVNQTDVDFGLLPQNTSLDMGTSLAGGRSRRGFEKTYGIRCENTGTVETPASVELRLPPEVSFTACTWPGTYAPAPDHAVRWDLGTLPPGEVRWIWTRAHIPPVIPLGTILQACAEVSVVGIDANPANDVSCVDEEVTGSFDPNEKRVSPLGAIAAGRELSYTIEFQNVGTDTAFTVVVRDTLASTLDPASLIQGASSHPYTFLQTGAGLVWWFHDIELPDSTVDEPGSRGFVQFRVRARDGLSPGTLVENRASIYFDFNEPVVTNTVVNTIADLPEFVRGDVDASGELNISDPIYNLAYQFAGGPEPPCMDAADDDDSGELNISDPISSLCYQFSGGPDCPQPPPPFPGCGPDPTVDPIGCGQFPPCDGKARPASPVSKVVDGSKQLLLEAVSGTSPDTLNLKITVVTDVPLAGLEGMAGFDPSRLQFVRLVPSGSSPRMDFLSARDLTDPPRVRLGGVPDFGLAEVLAPGTCEIGRLVFARRGPTVSLDGAVWLTEARFVGKDLRAYRIEGGPLVDPAVSEVSGGESGAGPGITRLRVTPNPFTRNTTLYLAGPAATAARVRIFDAAGRLVRTAWEGSLAGHEMSIVWDGTDQSGREVPAGIYLFKVESTGGEASGRLVKSR